MSRLRFHAGFSAPTAVLLAKLLLIAAGFAAIFSSMVAVAQMAAAAQPSFAVSSVRPSDPNAGKGMSVSVNEQSLKCSNVTLMMLIRMAYDLSDDQISGGPSWVASRRFDIAAKSDAPKDPNLKPDAARELQKHMLQQLLAERFQLKVHHGTKDIPGYLLTVAKGGTKGLQADDSNGPSISITDGKLEAKGATMDQIAYVLAQRILQSPVTNTTGLAGKFDLKLTWDPAQTRNAAAADAATDNGPSIFLALEQQLGVKLEPHKTPADAVVIESAQLPSEN